MYFKVVPARGGYRAHFYSANHELVWWTKVYVRRGGAEHAISLLRQGGSAAPLL
jgi:uncharacterized protein YegP (UPF0339 family)